VIASRLPVIKADAIDPTSPDSTERMRPSIASRTLSTNVTARSRQPASTGGVTTFTVPCTKPDAPMRWKSRAAPNDFNDLR
jgi:hypothetical protein